MIIKTKIKSLPYSFIDKNRRPILLKEATSEDHEKILRMYQEYEPKESFQGLPPADPEKLIAWVSSMVRDSFNIVGVIIGNKVVCHGSIFKIDEDRSEFIVIVSMKYQLAGIGTQLTRAIKKVSKEMGFSKIWLCVEPYNLRARHIYTKLGFELTTGSISEECEMLVNLANNLAVKDKVKKIMTRDVKCLNQDQLAYDAVSFFIEDDISGMPVVNFRNELIGFVTETNLIESCSSDTRIVNIMTKEVTYVREDTKIEEVVDYICDGKYKQFPVVSGPELNVVGIVSRKDVIKHLFRNNIEQS